MTKLLLTVSLVFLLVLTSCAQFQEEEIIEEGSWEVSEAELDTNLTQPEDPYEGFRCANNRVQVCHREEGRDPTTICLYKDAVEIHLGHGDTLGACEDDGKEKE